MMDMDDLILKMETTGSTGVIVPGLRFFNELGTAADLVSFSLRFFSLEVRRLFLQTHVEDGTYLLFLFMVSGAI